MNGSNTMQDSSDQPGTLNFSGETLLLWVAVGLAVIFLGLLAFDLIRRRRRERHLRRRERKGLRETLLKPVHQAQALKGDLEQMLQERAHHKDRQQPNP